MFNNMFLYINSIYSNENPRINTGVGLWGNTAQSLDCFVFDFKKSEYYLLMK